MRLFLFSLMCFCSCTANDPVVVVGSHELSFHPPMEVKVWGYNDDIMEPFVSRDGKWLFFNNSNDPSVNTDIHYAEKVSDTFFLYKGPLRGVNTPLLDGVPTMDRDGHFYFVTTRNYAHDFSTLYTGNFDNGSVNGITMIPGISKETMFKVNFDVEVSADGNTLYFADGRFDNNWILKEADVAMATKTSNGFMRASSQLFKNINTNWLEYAVGISEDELTIFFTRVERIEAGATPQIFYATRLTKSQPFDMPREITTIDGFVEAPSLSGDTLVYFHRKENRHRLYCIRRR